MADSKAAPFDPGLSSVGRLGRHAGLAKRSIAGGLEFGAGLPFRHFRLIGHPVADQEDQRERGHGQAQRVQGSCAREHQHGAGDGEGAELARAQEAAGQVTAGRAGIPGVDRAIEIAGAAGVPLKIAAKIDKVDQEYFDTCVQPLLNGPDIEFVGEVGYPEKSQFLGNAAALLFPISWPEPFGLVMIEAMACGTPAIAYPFGSVPEVMADGVSGFIVPDLKRAVEAVKKIDTIDRKKVRKHFEQHFTAERMAREYLKIYERLVNRKKAPLAASNGVLSWMKVTSPSNTT